MQQSIKVAISEDCLWSFAVIAKDKQAAVIKFLSQFRKNPMSPGINYEKIQSAADPKMRSVRIDQNYRGIVLKPDTGNVYCLLWIDKHDNAYEWARTHKVAINPEIGNIQIFSSTSEQVEIISSSNNTKKGLFAELKDRELIRLGVPEKAISIVRAICSEDELNESQKRLPVDAFEALFFFAAGESYEEIIREREVPESVDTTDFVEAFNRDATKRHFVVITDDSDLEALLAAPLASWRVFLHPSQRKLIERDWNGAVRVLGGAGTGKTVVAMHRAVWLARKYKDIPGKPVLFTTFTRTLADDIKTLIAMIASPAERERIEIINMDQWAAGLLRRFGYRQELLFDEKRRKEIWTRALTRKPDGVEYLDSFYRAEFERVVLPQGCETVEDYIKASRMGRGVQLSRPQRGAMWPVFAEYRSQLRSANLREPEEAYRDALALLKKEGGSFGIHSIVVDETQDLSAAALALLRAAVVAGPNDMFVVGDAHQRIYRHKVTLSRVGIDIKGRGHRLKINYRTTDEIRLWAVAKLANCAIDDLDGQPDSLMGYRSLSHGAKPEEILNHSREDERKAILDTLTRLDAEGFSTRGICIVVHTNAEATEYANWLEKEGKQILKLDKNTGDDDDSLGIRVATMHRVKGLEFDAIIIAGYRSPEFYANELAEDNDAGVLVDALTNERCLLHVAATRAKKYLLVSTIS